MLLHRALPDILPNWLKTVGLDEASLRKIEYYDNGPLLVSAAENGLGIALVLEDMVKFSSDSSGLARPFGECAATPYSYFLAAKHASGNSKALMWFRDWLLEEAASDTRSLMRRAEYE